MQKCKPGLALHLFLHGNCQLSYSQVNPALEKGYPAKKGLTRVETFLECKLTEEGSPVTVIHPGLENGFQTVVSAVSQRESIQLYLSLAKLKSRINRSADLKAEQIRLKKGLNERKSLHTYCKCAA